MISSQLGVGFVSNSIEKKNAKMLGFSGGPHGLDGYLRR